MAEGALLKVMERLPHALIDAIAQRLTERELALGLGLCSTSLQRSQKQILQRWKKASETKTPSMYMKWTPRSPSHDAITEIHVNLPGGGGDVRCFRFVGGTSEEHLYGLLASRGHELPRAAWQFLLIAPECAPWRPAALHELLKDHAHALDNERWTWCLTVGDQAIVERRSALHHALGSCGHLLSDARWAQLTDNSVASRVRHRSIALRNLLEEHGHQLSDARWAWMLAVERDGPGLIKHARLRRDVEALRLLGHGNLAIVSGRNSALHHLLAHHGNDLTLRRKRDIRGLIHSTFVNGSIWSYGGSIVER